MASLIITKAQALRAERAHLDAACQSDDYGMRDVAEREFRMAGRAHKLAEGSVWTRLMSLTGHAATARDMAFAALAMTLVPLAVCYANYLING